MTALIPGIPDLGYLWPKSGTARKSSNKLKMSEHYQINQILSLRQELIKYSVLSRSQRYTESQ